MAKLYYKRYKKRISEGEVTIDEVINLAMLEIPDRWKEDVIALIRENYGESNG